MVQPLQRQRQQRQRISPFGGLREEPIHQRRFDRESPPGCGGTPGRADDDLGVPGGGQRSEFIEHYAAHPGQLRSGL